MEPLGPDWWTVVDVARYLNVKPNSVRSYLARGRLPQPQYVGSTAVWRAEVIKEWAANRPRAPKMPDHPGDD